MGNEQINSLIKYQRFGDNEKQNTKVKYENYSDSSKDRQFYPKYTSDKDHLLSSNKEKSNK